MTTPRSFDEIVGDDLTVSIQPRPLSEESAASLVRERLAGDVAAAFSRACHSATGGNPLLLDELLKALAAEGVLPDVAHVGMVADVGPAAVSRSVLLRLRRLPEETVKVANAVAVLGDGASLGTIAALAGLRIDEAVRAAGALAQAEILRPGEPIGFVHPLVGAAVYADLPPLGRAAEHERAVALLVAAGAPAEQVAAHLVKVEGRADPAAVDILLPRRPGGAAEGRRRERGEPARAGAAGASAASAAGPGAARARTGRSADPGPGRRRAPRRGLRDARRTLARATTAQALARVLLFTGHPADGAAIARAAAAELPSDLQDLAPRARGVRASCGPVRR